jgi:glucose-1-phosphate thymidylyltransferase
MKAVILAAGQGTRLRPVTLTMPKPLVPVANKPLIVYAIDVLKNAGLKEIGIVVHDLSSPIVDVLGDGADLGVKLDYIVQTEQKGLAHAIGLARDFVAGEPFCVYLGDNIFQDKMTQVISNFTASDAEAVIGLCEVPDPTRFGIAEIHDGQITRVVEKPKDPPSNLAIAGVYLFRSSVFAAIDQTPLSWRNEYEITDAIQLLIASKQRVDAYPIQGWWIDAGKPDSIMEANQLVLGEMPYSPAPENGQVKGNSDVSHRVILGENSEIIDSVVRGPVIIGDNVKIINSYIGPYTSLGNDVVVENSEIEASIVMKNCSIRNIQGRIDSSLLADNSQVTAESKRPGSFRFILAENSYVHL